MKSQKIIIIDPPAGWRYGFPKPIPEERRKDVNKWLVEQGYPQRIIDEYGDYFYCRYWEDDAKPVKSINKAIIKFNNAKLALLCSGCRKIIKTGKEFNEEESKYAKGEIDYLEPLYCEKCKVI